MDEEEEEEEMMDGDEVKEEEEEEDEFIKDWVVNQFVSQPQLPPKAVTKQHQKTSSSSSDSHSSSSSRSLNQRRKPISSSITTNSSDPSENIKNWNVDIIKFSKNVEHTNRAATSRFWDIMEVIFFNLLKFLFFI